MLKLQRGLIQTKLVSRLVGETKLTDGKIGRGGPQGLKSGRGRATRFEDWGGRHLEGRKGGQGTQLRDREQFGVERTLAKAQD